MTLSIAALSERLWPRRPGRKFVVLHIPKTAGTSLHSSLAEGFGRTAVSPLFDHAAYSAGAARRLRRYRVVQGHLSYTEAAEAFPDRAFIVFLRDPCERCLSWYFYLRRQSLEGSFVGTEIRGENTAREAISLAGQLEPAEFFQSDHPHVLQNILDRQTYQLGDRIPLAERSADREAVLEAAVGNLRSIAFLGLQERYAADFHRLSGWLGLPAAGVRVAANVTKGRPRLAEQPDAVRQCLRERNELDLKLYAEAQRLLEGVNGDEGQPGA